MNKETEYKKFFRFTSLVTDVFPKRGARVLDFAVRNLLGNVIVSSAVERQARKQSKGVISPERILVAADLNIGDALIAQGVVAALKEIFPITDIDCVVKKSAQCLIDGNPQIAALYPLYEGAPYPNDSDIKGLAGISTRGNYDLIINMSPMVDDKTFGGEKVVNYSMMAAELIRNEGRQGQVTNNVVYQSHNFAGRLFNERLPRGFGKRFRGVSIYLSEEAIGAARIFLLSNGLSPEEPIVMVNPDASAKFTRMPFDFQLNLLRKLADAGCTILLGAGHVEKYIEHELIYSLAPEHRRRITLIPRSTPLDVYSALIDSAYVYISGDTGPLHIAASRKFVRGSGQSLRNRTAVFSVFGGTPSHIYGYDSVVPGFMPANQDAPSRAFVAVNRCRNITCINKMAKTCKEVRCFHSLDPGLVALEALKYLAAARKISRPEKLRILVK